MDTFLGTQGVVLILHVIQKNKIRLVLLGKGYKLLFWPYDVTSKLCLDLAL